MKQVRKQSRLASRHIFPWLFVPLLVLAPSLVWAHGSLPGMRGFYVGALHPLTSVSHVLLILVLSLFIEFRACIGDVGKRLMVMGVSVLLGLISGLIAAQVFVENWISVCLSGLVGLLVVLPWTVPQWIVLSIVSLAAFALGFESIPDPGRMGDVLITCFGSLVGVCCLIFYGMQGAAVLHQRFNADWLRVGVRVAASWVTAVSVLMLAFYLRA